MTREQGPHMDTPMTAEETKEIEEAIDVTIIRENEKFRQLSEEIKGMSDQELLNAWSGNCNTKMGMHDERRSITEDEYDQAVYGEICRRKLLEKK